MPVPVTFLLMGNLGPTIAVLGFIGILALIDYLIFINAGIIAGLFSIFIEMLIFGALASDV